MTPADMDFDPVLLSQARLGVVSVLMTRASATFSDLRALLGLTQGNLGVHLRKLEDAGYVSITKKFVARKPRTTCRLTRRGRGAFHRHLARLEEIAKKASTRGGATPPP